MKTSDDDVIFLVERNLSALTMVFGELTPSLLEDQKVFVKIVSSMNLLKMVSLKKDTNKSIMSMTVKESMVVNVLKTLLIFK